MKKLLFIILVGIFSVFVFLVRFSRLAGVPIHLGNDEISNAYDAYSIGLTLRDHHNHFLPISFQSHGDYKAPLYVYLSVMPVKIFGNTEFAARFICAIAGLLTILILGFLVYKISGNKAISFVSAAILAFSPWHIYMSRMALEMNLAFLLLVLGIYLYLLFYQDQTKLFFLICSSLAFSLSAYSYHTQKMLSPLLIITLPFFCKLKSLKTKFFFWFLSFVLFLPIFIGFSQQVGTNSRANTEMVWNNPAVYDYLFQSNNAIILKFSVLFSAIISNCSAYINFGYLFFNGLALFPQKTPYGIGLLLPVSLPFLIIGLISTKKYFGKYNRFILFLTIICFLVPAFTRGDANSRRSLQAVAPLSILIATGLVVVWEKAKFLLKLTIVLSHFLFIAYFLVFYFVHFPVYSGENWQYGYKQIALVVGPLYEKYENIIIDSRFGPYNQYVGVPHLYIPYFTNLDPQLLLQSAQNNGGIGKYQMREIDWNKENLKPKTLYAVPEANLPPPALTSFRLLKMIELPNGKPAFRIFETTK